MKLAVGRVEAFLDGGGPHGIRATSVGRCVNSGGKVINGGTYEFPYCKCGLVTVDLAKQDCQYVWRFQGGAVLVIVMSVLTAGLILRKIVRKG